MERRPWHQNPALVPLRLGPTLVCLSAPAGVLQGDFDSSHRRAACRCGCEVGDWLSLQGQTCQEAGGGVAGSPCSSTLGIRAGAPQEGGEKPNPEREGSQDSGKGREPLSPLGLKGQRQEREALLEARISGHLGDAGSFQACLRGAGIPEG